MKAIAVLSVDGPLEGLKFKAVKSNGHDIDTSSIGKVQVCKIDMSHMNTFSMEDSP